MNIIFFGSSNFAVPALKALLKTPHKISGVVTQPDRQKGRGLALSPTPVKAVASEAGLQIYQPACVNTAETINLLKGLKPDLFVVIAYGQLLSQKILDTPSLFSINVHSSLLPKYRGAAPINWAIINSEEITGVTVIRMAAEMDAGPIILQKTHNIANNDNAITLEDSLSGLAARLLLDSLEAIKNNAYSLTSQDDSQVSFAPKLKKEDGRINWNKPAPDIYNLIRGCLPWPSAFTYYKGKLLKIYSAKITVPEGRKVILRQAQDTSPKDTERSRSARSPGEVISASREGIAVATTEGSLIIQELQAEGRRRMKAEEFICGHKISIGEILGNKK